MINMRIKEYHPRYFGQLQVGYHMSIAYIYGMYAYSDGRRFKDNPYLESDPQHEQWNEGFHDADMEDSE